MKKARVYALCAAILFGVTGCSNSDSSIKKESKETEITTTKTQPESSTTTEEVTEIETLATTTTARVEDKTVKAVSMCSGQSAAIDEDGTLYMWGNNEYGALGDGTMTNKLTPTKIMDKVDMISVSGDYSAAITEDRNLYTWGRNFSGQLGDGTTIDRQTPVKIMDKIQTVSVGSKHSAAITEDGSLYMWGWNYRGQLGDGKHIEKWTMDYVEGVDRNTPYKIMDNIKSVSLGTGWHSAAICTDGDLYMWGYNYKGEIGDGTTEDKYLPTKIMSNVRDVSIGFNHSAAITEDGDLYMWGYNKFGQLGDGTTEDKHSPVKVLDNVKRISLGERHSAAVTEDGSLYLWGYNFFGQIGNGKKGIDSNKPIKVMNNVESISLGASNSAAVTKDGKLYTWGLNKYGQLGDGTTEDKSTPTQIFLSTEASNSSATESIATTTNNYHADSGIPVAVSNYVQSINDFLENPSNQGVFPFATEPLKFEYASGGGNRWMYSGFNRYLGLYVYTDDSGEIINVETTTRVRFDSKEILPEWCNMMCIAFMPIAKCKNAQELKKLWKNCRQLEKPMEKIGYNSCTFAIKPEFVNKNSENWIGYLCVGPDGTKTIVTPHSK